MIPGIIAGGIVGTVAPTYLGALVRRGSDFGAPGANVIVPWDVEVYDRGDWHSTSSDTDRMTVPTGVSLVRVSHGVLEGSRLGISTLLDGNAIRGMGSISSQTAGDNSGSCASALLEVSPGNYLQCGIYSPTSQPNALASPHTWFAIEAVDPSTKRALLYRTSNQAISAGTTTQILWDAEVYDTDNFHSTSSSTELFTVPSGVTLVRVGGGVDASNSGQGVLSFLKNGGTAMGLPNQDVEVNGNDWINAWSAPLEVSPGDTFAMQIFATNAINIGNAERNWFAIEEVPSNYARALVYKTGNQSIADNTTIALTWDAEVYDTHAIHDNSTNNSRLTVPNGFTQARLCFSVNAPSATGQRVAHVRKNGSADYGLPRQETDSAGADGLAGMGAWVDVVPGDYFELYYFQNSGSSMNIGNANNIWFCAEFR